MLFIRNIEPRKITAAQARAVTRPDQYERSGQARPCTVGVQGACVEQKALPKSNAKDSRQCERGLLHVNRSAAPVIAATRGARRGLRPLPSKLGGAAGRRSERRKSVLDAERERRPRPQGTSARKLRLSPLTP